MKKKIIYLTLLAMIIACNKQEIKINQEIELNKNWTLLQEETGKEYKE